MSSSKADISIATISDLFITTSSDKNIGLQRLYLQQPVISLNKNNFY